ncbi:MAG TPA: hypothetical protein VF490_22115 [Chryseosolibacter sp.]
MRTRSKAIFGACLLFISSSCVPDQTDQATLDIFPINFNFADSDQGWTHGFAEYPSGPADSALFELKYAYTDQPSEFMLVKRSFMLSGKNLNNDLFMYIKKKITGLKPQTDYTITYTVELTSDFAADSQSATGSVYLKAGATPFEPKTVDDAGYFVMNIDKGNAATPGQHMVSLGDIITPAKSAGYTLLTRNNTMANSRYVGRTNADGELWLIVGTDSSYGGTTTVFYNRINVVFSAS